jgi:hypothetical protein
MSVSISDVGNALVVIDLEIDRLHCENVALRATLAMNESRISVMSLAMKKLIETAKYEVEYVAD